MVDNEKPVITAPAVLSCYQAGNNGCNINLGTTATDNCGILSFTRNGPACFPVGTTTVTWTATDVNGNTSTANQTVTRNPEINITLCAGPTDIIYSGKVSGSGPFGPTSVTISSSVVGGTPGYTYSWSPGGATTSNRTVSPTTTTTYTLTVTDSKGCTRSISKTIQVLPLSAAVCSGNGNNVKFAVCHISPDNPANKQNICIAPSSLSSHLTSGSSGHMNCYLGPCRNLCVNTTAAPTTRITLPVTELSKNDNTLTVNASPNPSGTYFEIKIQSEDMLTPATIRITNTNGNPVETFRNVAISTVLKFGSNYINGSYFVEVMQGNLRKTVKLIKAN